MQPQTDNGAVWVPRRTVSVLPDTQTQIDALTNSVSSLATTVNTTPGPVTTEPPAIATSVGAVESPYKSATGELLSLVSVSWVNTDPNFSYADVYLTGYHGSATPEFVASGATSPLNFLCETTRETVTVTVVSACSTGLALPFSVAPTTTVALDGVVSAPPPPSIAVSLVRTPLGYTFSFNAEEGLLADVISCYHIYRNTTNLTSGATQIQTINQSPANTGAIQVQDVKELNSAVNYFYWVSAVNTSGLESTKTSAGLLTKGAYAKQVTGVSATESPYKTASGQLVSLVDVSFTPGVDDAYFKSVEIWFTGFNGSSIPQLMAEGTTSPVSFLCETTHEAVEICVVAISSNGIATEFAQTTWNGAAVTWRSTWDSTITYAVNDGVVYSNEKYYIAKAISTNVIPLGNSDYWVEAPITSVALDGVMSPPPPPTINQAQVALIHDTGWQFSFNVEGGLLQDLIDGYWVYHSLTDTTPVPPDCRYEYIRQASTNLGVCTVQEVTDEQLYYWVSAVNIAGMESTLTWVPVTFVDPGDPAPAPPPDVTQVVKLQPATILNGWANGVHVGDYLAGWSTGGSGEYAMAFTNPTNAIDGNEGTYAIGAGRHHKQDYGCVWGFGSVSLPAGATVTSAKLNILTEVQHTAGFAGHAGIWYSLDSGSTWTQVYRVTSIRAKLNDVVTLPGGQDLTHVQVEAFVESHDDAAQLVYTINAEVTYTAPAGPPKISGVRASLVAGNVKIDWTASNVTITDYEVYRVVHGGGYPASHLKATIASGTTTWTDTTAHDSYYDYYVIADNAASWSAPSAPANIIDANGMIYTGGATVDSLKPAAVGADVTGDNTANDVLFGGGRTVAEAGADQTAGKSIDILSDGTARAWITSTQRTNAVDVNGNILLKNVDNADGVTYLPTTTSLVFVTIPEMTTTIVTKSNKVLTNFVCTFVSSTGGYWAIGVFAIFRDGVQVSPEFQAYSQDFSLGGVVTVAGSYVDDPAAGSHTFDLRWHAVDTLGSGLGTSITAMGRTFQVVELG